jgi:putative hydrolase of the HAD superfamily
MKAVIFDLFHTLTGLESEWSDLPITSEVLGFDRRAWDDALTVHSQWRVVGEVRDPYEILRRLALQVDPKVSDDLVRKALKIRIARFRDALARIPAENIEVVRTLRRAGMRVGLISNADTIEVASWSSCPAAGVFDAELFSCEVGMAKPQPEIYRKCLEMLDVAPEEAMFVGDGGSNELAGAKEVGLKTVFISGVIQNLWPERIPQRCAIADHHIVHLPEILGIPGLLA